MALTVDQDGKVHVTLGMALRPFWSMAWRTWLIALAAVIVNVLVLFILEASGYPQAHFFMPFAQLAEQLHHQKPAYLPQQGWIGLAKFFQSILFQVVLLTIVFQKSWRDFRLEPRDTATNTPISLSYKQSFKLFWSMFWRQFLLLIGFMIVLGIVAALAAVVAKILSVFIFVIGTIVGFIFIILKTYAIIMQKRYSDFYMTVVPNAPVETIQ